MKDCLHTVIIPGKPSIGPLPLLELRERLRREPVSDEATVLIHTRLGDHAMPLGRHPILRERSIQPANSVVCPHCESTQPTVTPGTTKCTRCGTTLIVSDGFEVTLGSDPKRPWLLSILGLVGLLCFTKIYPNQVGFFASLSVGFGVPFVMMLRQGVIWGRYGKFTAREAPILYATMVALCGLAAFVGIVMLFVALTQHDAR